MSSKNPAQRLRDILENIEAIEGFTTGMALEDFVRDRKTVYAVTRALEIISEASRRLPEQLRSRHTPISIGQPWLPPAMFIVTSTKPLTRPWFGTLPGTA